jgi:hypothetical protein
MEEKMEEIFRTKIQQKFVGPVGRTAGRTGRAQGY